MMMELVVSIVVRSFIGPGTARGKKAELVSL